MFFYFKMLFFSFAEGTIVKGLGDFVPTKAGLKLHVGSLKILRHGWRFSCGGAEEF